ncbi:MAG: patatin-like phospholipase family protein [Fimbriimonadaceae bacterium]|nr:patatin-like phospholipase family protein [Chitinophagales bacterium]
MEKDKTFKVSPKKKIRILCIDGGGIRGIIPAQVLIRLENKIQKQTNNTYARLANYFDFFAGTSTSGILTAIFLYPSKKDSLNPEFSAEDALELYYNNGTDIFDLQIKQLIALGMWDEKYSVRNFEKLLEKYFRQTTVKELLKPCLITTYDIEGRRTRFFTSHDAKKNADKNFRIKDVCRATSAGPTYFEAAHIESVTGTPYTLIDGGVFANDPTLCAYSELRNAKSKPSAKDMFILSVGTGNVDTSYEFENAKKWGAIGWAKPIIDIMMSANSETNKYHLKRMFSVTKSDEYYVRIEPKNLMHANAEMDDASPENMQTLLQVGAATAEDNDALLDKIADFLIKNGDYPVEFE